MKKWIALLMAAVLLLFLTACGEKPQEPSRNDLLVEKYQVLLNAMESENYESALYEVMRHMPTEPPTEAPETEPTEPKAAYTAVELTTDNWQEYLEFDSAVEWDYNAFGEAMRVSIVYGLRLKEEYVDRLPTSEDEGYYDMIYAPIAIEYSYRADDFRCEIDFGAETYVIGEKIWEGEKDSMIREMDFEDFIPTEYNHNGLSYLRDAYSVDNGDGFALNGVLDEFEILRISGAIYLRDE